MKKIVIILISLFCLISCCLTTNYDMQVEYEICYPDTIMKFNKVFHCKGSTDDVEDGNINVYSSSYKGTNYIRITPGDWNEFERTTCPVRVLSYKRIVK